MFLFLFLFLLVSQHSMVTTSSGCYSGKNKDHRPLVSCESQGLSALPDGIDPGTEVLVLSHNEFVSLSWAAYSNFTGLHELNLTQNLISTIDQSGPVLKNLSVLWLSNNKLTSLGGATFKSAPSLKEVYLDGNTIRSLDNATFSDLPHLEIIDLSRNKLHILPPHLLEHISSNSLKTFDLEENNIQHLPDQFFASKDEIPYVYLSKNAWVCTCQVSYLQRFLEDQSFNIYIHTGLSSLENDPESVVCSAPPTLEGRAIVDLKEEEYCSSFDYSQHSAGHTTQITSATTTALTTKTIQPTVIPTTTPTTVQPTTTNSAGSSTTPIPTRLTINNPTTITPPTTEPTTPISTILTTTTPRRVLSVHGGGQRSVPWCWWLFITVLLLCIFSAIFSCMLFLWLIITYITLYQPIKRQVHSGAGVTLRAYQVTADQSLTVDRPEEQRVLFLPPEMIRETQPVFRSVLFISKGDEDGEADEKREGTRDEDEEKTIQTDALTKIDLLPAVTLHREQVTESKDRKEVFRKTLYRVISREEEIEGWKEVEENCWGMMERDKGRREGGVERGKTRRTEAFSNQRKAENTMTVYNLYIFDRNGTCLHYSEWNRKKQAGISKEEEFKLMYGMLFSIRSFVSKMSPLDMKDGFVSFQTSRYKLHYYETPTGIKVVMNTDLGVPNCRDVLHQIYSTVYVECIVKNPLCELGGTLQSELFSSRLDSFIRALPFFSVRAA
ncbi:hypothetical protein PHYPO_G00250510 [Pangasianodon hypophthalmus]|uniref:Trafficking protein particle complex subunit 1 n=2 Tax=Siluroidei TaxID=1489793 RepID=A0A5N5JBA2_PANHP|nr:hypothetical protein PHYPO_G00250510 [Pangasianodon hypophthalmus]